MGHAIRFGSINKRSIQFYNEIKRVFKFVW